MGKILKSTQSTIKRKFFAQYLQKKFHFLIPITFIEWNFMKTEQQMILWKVSLYNEDWYKVLNSDIFYNMFRQSPLMFPLWTIVPLVYWKELFLSANLPWLRDSESCGKGMEINTSEIFLESLSIMEIVM